ncbi:preprotein translocase subunit SecE [Alkalihalobacillus alcalophilus ATCC 27647 = CGMCC 1.3604]|uniref:Protein translocase subunit SecE n=1 Tax=Alkalihalobacillus alcalophilus ATCC 27647 = CGMCC 1.3604 TaxID=1218173 RepID=A0A094WNC3_ALKAL|nr:preprotein translocase subunit SecE [Alkalihalobacillus alcalophilus]KGA98331.1 preprotein translocase subunit SecE [Alkalihalobacillus alcalophilus ATCC 27647 = CGMCC 1.3604]MED1561649.1 preprotein translocase subunit SecE [Alkalihalobacillus alcalophilus]THG89927.1 preprotein translocase subunit SecE [Alkalihalobacillus alcalophilus ATCC 27647 = CGMCC 1.3604]
MASEKSSGNFFGGVVREMKRVSWPTRKELTRYTIVVVTTVLIMSIFFWLVDLGISAIVEQLVR